MYFAELKGMKKDEAIKSINKWAKELKVEEYLQMPAEKLSKGNQQKIQFMTAIIHNPELVVLDEPFSALDYQTRLQVSGDIGNIIREHQKTAILVTHNLSEAISLADKIIVLTKRPATIKKIVSISLTITDSSPLGYRSAPEFNEYFNEIWEDLCDESKS